MIECRAPLTKQELQKYYFLRWQVLREPWSQPQGSERDECEAQAIHRAVFDLQKNVLAVGRLDFTDQFHAQIRYMAVVEQAQGNGYGQQVLMALEHEASRRGAKKITLQARESAVTFYQQLGYQLVKKSHLLYGEIQHFTMQKNVAALPEHQESVAMQLQNVWHNTIPLSKAMNIAISYYDGTELLTHCEPTFNKNLHQTMFAGSIYTLATLTGWGWVYLQLAKDGCHGDRVLADATIKYLAPIAGVACAKTKQQSVIGDTQPLTVGKNARFTLDVEILSGDKIAAKFTGQYVVIPSNE